MSSTPSDEGEPTQRTLTHDTALLREFDESDSSDLLVLYHHVRDQEFDCHNAREYHTQLAHYYSSKFAVVEVVPRKIGVNDYLLVCLRHPETSKNSLCQMAFQCQRQFVGMSMLVKRRCFVCHQHTAKKCSACHCACYCSKECLKKGWPTHKAVCKLIKAAGAPRVEAESVQLDPEVELT